MSLITSLNGLWNFKKYIKEKKCLKRITIPGGRPLTNIPLHLLEGKGSGYILHCKKDGENVFTVRMFSLVCTISSSISMEATQQQAFMCSFMNMRGIHWLHLQWSLAKVASVLSYCSTPCEGEANFHDNILNCKY